MPAGITAAIFVERTDVVAVARVAQPDGAVAGEYPAVARIARGHHAIEHVDAALHGVHNIGRRADPHQIPRRAGRQPRCHVAQDAQHVFLRLAHRQPADCIAIEADVLQAGKGFVAQSFMHAALNDAEQCVRIAFMRPLAALGPTQRKPHGIGCFTLVGRIRRTFVENHDHIGIERALDAHRLLRRQETDVAVHRRAEPDALFADLA